MSCSLAGRVRLHTFANFSRSWTASGTCTVFVSLTKSSHEPTPCLQHYRLFAQYQSTYTTSESEIQSKTEMKVAACIIEPNQSFHFISVSFHLISNQARSDNLTLTCDMRTYFLTYFHDIRRLFAKPIRHLLSGILVFPETLRPRAARLKWLHQLVFRHLLSLFSQKSATNHNHSSWLTTACLLCQTSWVIWVMWVSAALDFLCLA